MLAKIGTIGVVVPEDDFVGSIKRTNQISLLMSLLILILAIIIAIFVSRTISRPIVQLANETQNCQPRFGQPAENQQPYQRSPTAG
jgi:signal transduction histidine kinase